MAQRDTSGAQGAAGLARPGTAGARIALRPITPADEPFLLAVYASTRADELALVDWDEGQKAAFVQMQFAAQSRYYQERYADAAFQVILCGGVPVGRLYVARWPAEIRIIDITLLPQRGRQGIGSALLNDLLAEATREGKRVSIHVERFNPALRLYARLGFRPVADHGVYLFLEWTPGAEPTPPASQPAT